MGFNFCPTAVVAAPVETVWDLLWEPRLYDEWWDASTERIVPEGPSAPGQVRYLKTSGLGRTWTMSLRVERVDAEKHQIQLHVMLPLGMINDVTVTCTPLDAVSCLVQFG
jgi:uncharacterized protein YndB with AHSA1/START domain